MSTCFLLNHEKNLAKIRAVVFVKNVKPFNSDARQIRKIDVASKGQFQQPFSSLMTLYF